MKSKDDLSLPPFAVWLEMVEQVLSDGPIMLVFTNNPLKAWVNNKYVILDYFIWYKI